MNDSAPTRHLAHQYVDRYTGQVRTEKLIADNLICWIYSTAREHAPLLFNALVTARMTRLLGCFHFDWPLARRVNGTRLFTQMGIDPRECVDPPDRLDTPRRIFERRIRYWECRPMPDDADIIVSPADAKLVLGSLSETNAFFIKEKFFHYADLLGHAKTRWLEDFAKGDFAVFRLTPEKYHYNHFPVSGRIEDHYLIDGAYHSCNPGAVVSVMTPFSQNKRCVTIIDTDVPDGTGVGRVAMIEVVALMIGDIVQCYSPDRYESPRAVRKGMWVSKGQPKSLYRPGSSVDILFFQQGRVEFEKDLLANQQRVDVRSRYLLHFQKPLVETDVAVRSAIARRLSQRQLPVVVTMQALKNRSATIDARMA